MIVEIATIGGIIGCIMVAKGKALIANVIWSISNLFMIVYTFTVLEYHIMLMFLIYEIIALYGVYNLTRKAM